MYLKDLKHNTKETRSSHSNHSILLTLNFQIQFDLSILRKLIDEIDPIMAIGCINSGEFCALAAHPLQVRDRLKFEEWKSQAAQIQLRNE